jgi:hypothetical protein
MKGQQDGTSGASAAYYPIDQRSKKKITAKKQEYNKEEWAAMSKSQNSANNFGGVHTIMPNLWVRIS